MNMLLLENETPDKVYTVRGDKFLHIKNHLKLSVGDSIKFGIKNGKVCIGEITNCTDDAVILKTVAEKSPPLPSNVKIIMAIPRPKVLKRVLKHIITFGVKDICLINTWSVEKSFLKSSLITKRDFTTIIDDALEQCVDTIVPNIEVFDLYKPFVEDVLPQKIKGHDCYVAHPRSLVAAPYGVNTETYIAIGPDRGFNEFEISSLENLGFKGVTLGERIFHQESAIPYIIGRMQ